MNIYIVTSADVELLTFSRLSGPELVEEVLWSGRPFLSVQKASDAIQAEILQEHIDAENEGPPPILSMTLHFDEEAQMVFWKYLDETTGMVYYIREFKDVQ